MSKIIYGYTMNVWCIVFTIAYQLNWLITIDYKLNAGNINCIVRSEYKSSKWKVSQSAFQFKYLKPNIPRSQNNVDEESLTEHIMNQYQTELIAGVYGV